MAVEIEMLSDEVRDASDQDRDLRDRITQLKKNAVSKRIPPRQHNSPTPTTFAQERLCFLEQLEALGSSYTMMTALRLEGDIDGDVLETALRAIVRRHEALRTRFESTDGQVVQLIDPVPEGPLLERFDLSELEEQERDRQLNELVDAAGKRRFDLAAGPLFAAGLIRLSATEHVLTLGMHHIVSDAWSIGILLREINVLYEAFLQGRPSPLPELPIQYADYAIWQRQWLQGDVLDRQLSYWTQKLKGAPAALELPTDRPRPAVQNFRGANEGISLSPELTAELTRLARQEGATLFMVLLAGFYGLLSRYSGRSDIVVGTPVANRPRAETEGLIGFFVNTLALRVDLSGQPSFRELLARVRETALGAYGHQDLPFERLVEALQPVRDLSRQAVFQTMFVLQNALNVRRSPGGGPGWVSREITVSKFDLTMNLRETGQGVRGLLQYRTDLFDASTARRLVERYEMLLREVAADPDRALSELPATTDQDRAQLLEWGRASADYGAGECLHEMFAAQAARTPDATAVVFGDETLSYGELDRRSNQLAHHLKDMGVGPEQIVGLCVERSLEMIVGLFGILKAGGAYLPLDPAYPADRLRYMLEDAGAALVVSHAPAAPALEGTAVSVLRLDDDWPAIAAAPQTAPDSGARPSNLAYVIYTSGSTGRPKGVMTQHANAANYLHFLQDTYEPQPGDRVLQVATISFDASVRDLVAPLTWGASIVLVETSRSKDADHLAAVARERDVSCILSITPSLLLPLIEAMEKQGEDDLPSLRLILASGEALRLKDCGRFHKVAKRARLFNQYGPTECTMTSTYHQVDASEQATGSIAPIGRPVANAQLYILDEGLSLVPTGAVGELYIGGAGLARGYLNRPDLTAERFLPNPFGQRPGERMYRTGDLARWRSDGELEFIGRADNQVKVRGFRIEPGEIETALSSHGQVKEAVVVAHEAEEGDKRLVAYLTASGAERPNVAELRAWLAGRLPDYMIPALFQWLEQIPITPNGKVDRQALPAPDGERPDLDEGYVAPRTPVEELVAEVWADVLRLERVGAHDNFFDLGGHSLSAIRVSARLLQILNVELPLRTLFEAPTVEAFSRHLHKQIKS